MKLTTTRTHVAEGGNMNKVTNLTTRNVEVIGWRFLPSSTYAIDPVGNKTDHIPTHVAFSSVAKRLANMGVLEIDGYYPSKASPVESTGIVVEAVAEFALAAPDAVGADEPVEEITTDEGTPEMVENKRKRKRLILGE